MLIVAVRACKSGNRPGLVCRVRKHRCRSRWCHRLDGRFVLAVTKFMNGRLAPSLFCHIGFDKCLNLGLFNNGEMVFFLLTFGEKGEQGWAGSIVGDCLLVEDFGRLRVADGHFVGGVVKLEAVAIFEFTGRVDWFNGRSMNTGHQFNLIVFKGAIDNLGEPHLRHIARKLLGVLVVLVASGAVAHDNNLVDTVSGYVWIGLR